MRRVQAVTAEGCAIIMMIAITAMISTTVAITIMISMRASPFFNAPLAAKQYPRVWKNSPQITCSRVVTVIVTRNNYENNIFVMIIIVKLEIVVI